MTERRRLAVGCAVFVVAVAGWFALVNLNADVHLHQTDGLIYRDAGLAVRTDGRHLYTLHYGHDLLPFTYPPFAALFFALAAPAAPAVFLAVLTALTVCCLPMAAWAALRLAQRDLPAGAVPPPRATRLAVALVLAAIWLWLEPVESTLHFGQINVILLVLVLVDLAAPDHSRLKGIGVGLAAGIKLTPLIFVLYLLFSRRRAAAGRAALTFAATVGIGFAWLPHASSTFWTKRFSVPGDDPVRMVNQSLNGLVLRIAHNGSGAFVWWLVVAAVVGAATLALAVALSRRGMELAGVCVCALAALLVSPISWTHHWVFLMPALALPVYRLTRTRARVAIAVAMVVLLAVWPFPLNQRGRFDTSVAPHPTGLLRLIPHDGGAELHWSWWQVVLGDGYVIAGLACVAAVAGWLIWHRTPRRAAPTSAPPAPEPTSALAGLTGGGAVGEGQRRGR